MQSKKYVAEFEVLESRRLLSTVVSIGTLQDTAMRQTGQDGLVVVARRGDLSEDLTVPLIVSGTAANGTEYGRVGPRVTIPAGVRSVALNIRPVFPGAAGQSNYLSIALGDIAGVRFGAREAFVDVVDNPNSRRPDRVAGPTGPFSVSTTTGRRAAVVVTRTGDVTEPTTVPITVAGTAVNGVDFGRVGQQITFAPGQSTVTLNLRTLPGAFVGDRSVFVGLPGALPASGTFAGFNVSGASGSVIPSTVMFPVLNTDGTISGVPVATGVPTTAVGGRGTIGGTGGGTGGGTQGGSSVSTPPGGATTGSGNAQLPGAAVGATDTSTNAPLPLPGAVPPRSGNTTDPRFGRVTIDT